MMRREALFLLIILLWMAACNPAPTLAPVTATSEAPLLQNTAEPSPEASPTRRPLPPTWTPSGPSLPTPVQNNVPEQPDALQQVTPVATATLDVICANFTADYERIGDTFPLGTSPTIYWTRIPTAANYQIQVTDPQGEVILMGNAPGDATSYAIPPETFVVDPEVFQSGDVAVYTWLLMATNAQGVQVCHTPSGELIPMPNLEAPTQEPTPQ